MARRHPWDPPCLLVNVRRFFQIRGEPVPPDTNPDHDMHVIGMEAWVDDECPGAEVGCPFAHPSEPERRLAVN
jgi:hypothetical protein